MAMILNLFLDLCLASSFEIPPENLYTPSMQAQARLIRDGNHEFHVILADQTEFVIKAHNVRGISKAMSNETLRLTDCYFKLNRTDAEAKLEAYGRLRGGT